MECYARSVQPPSRADEDILKIFRDKLAHRQILTNLRPKKILTSDYEHEFPLAWKNNIWHVSEALSFDLTTSGNILEKANQWLGRAHTLAESQEDFKLYLLLGKPQQERLRASFVKAENILHKMPCPHEFIREDEAAAFAAEVENELKGHGEGQ